jgi:hypothetical protein
MPMHEVEYKERIRQLLLRAGTAGIKQRYITHTLCHQLNAQEITAVLEKWRAIGAVQKFRLDELPHRPITMWRATEKLAEMDEKGEYYVY